MKKIEIKEILKGIWDAVCKCEMMKEIMKGVWNAVCKFVLTVSAMISCLGAMGLLLSVVNDFEIRMMGFVLLCAVLTAVFFYEIFRGSWKKRRIKKRIT